MAVTVALALLLAAAQAAPLLSFPNQYTADAVMMLPYSGTSEPIRVYYDGVNNKSRTEYYSGMNVNIFRPDLYGFGSSFKIIPETNDQGTNIRSCVQINGTKDNAIAIQSLIPDMSFFKHLGQVHKRGELCEDWLYTYEQDSRTNVYHFYVSSVTGNPIQFHMMGYDYLFGSHYDEYVLNFLTWFPGPIADPTVFDVPKMTCGNFPGPGYEQMRGALALIEDPLRSEQEMQKEFSNWMAKHGRSYTNSEQRRRQDTFRNNARYINSKNRANLSFKLAINHLADLDAKELKAMRGHKSSKTSAAKATFTGSAGIKRPDSIDWRQQGAVSPVKDQGICGSCWSFATAQTIESANFLKTKKMIPLSPQALVDCSWGFGNNGCDGGEAERAFGWIMQQGGIPTEASYGVYEMADGLCHNKDSNVVIGASISSYTNVTSGNLDAFADALVAHGPLSIAIDAGHLSFVFYSSGVYFEPSCGNTPDDLDHAVLAVGYGTDATGGPYWIVKNSWSEYWGDQGYVRMSQKNNNCGVTTDANFVAIN